MFTRLLSVRRGAIVTAIGIILYTYVHRPERLDRAYYRRNTDVGGGGEAIHSCFLPFTIVRDNAYSRLPQITKYAKLLLVILSI